MTDYVLDTNIFNKLLDGLMKWEELPNDGKFFITHIQYDELNATPHEVRRTELLQTMHLAAPRRVPTESMVWGFINLFETDSATAEIYTQLKAELDARKKQKSNAGDGLIGELGIVNGYTLITADRNLSLVVQQMGGKVQFFRAPDTSICT